MIASPATPIPAQLQRLRLQMERAWPETSLGPVHIKTSNVVEIEHFPSVHCIS